MSNAQVEIRTELVADGATCQIAADNFSVWRYTSCKATAITVALTGKPAITLAGVNQGAYASAAHYVQWGEACTILAEGGGIVLTIISVRGRNVSPRQAQDILRGWPL